MHCVIFAAFDVLIGLAQADAHIGSIAAELQRHGLWDNTLIIVCRSACVDKLLLLFSISISIVERCLCRRACSDDAPVAVITVKCWETSAFRARVAFFLRATIQSVHSQRLQVALLCCL